MRVSRTLIWMLAPIICELAVPQQQQPVRNPQGLSILEEVLTKAGGMPAIAAINDFSGAGTVTYYWKEPAEGSATIRGLGLHEFRLDASLSGGERSWIVNGSSALLKGPDGSTTYLPSQNAVKPASTMFPLMQVVAALENTSTNVSYDGLVSHDGEQVYDIAIQEVLQNDPAGALGKITKTHIYVNPQSMTVFAIEDRAYAQRGVAEFPHELQFADYQSIDGIQVPLSITELISGQKTLSIQLSQMKFNTGLTSADFQ